MEKLLNKIIELLTALLLYFGISRLKTKYQTLEVSYNNATVAGTYTKPEQLDTNYDYCDGVQVIVTSNAGNNVFSIGIDDKNNTYQSITNAADYQSGNGVNPNHRYKDIYVPVISGEKVDVKTKFDAALGSDLKYQIIFRLRKK